MRHFGRILRHDATVDDLRALSPEIAAEIIDGELVEKAAPTLSHGRVQLGLGGQIRSSFDRLGGGGPGGWWIGSEVEVAYAPQQVFRHDLVGWRRERIPEMPRDVPVRIVPDWVCEILSPSNASNDTVKKLRTLHRHKVPHYWVVDPEARTLSVMRYSEPGYVTVVSAESGETVRAEPFEAIELDTRALFEAT